MLRFPEFKEQHRTLKFGSVVSIFNGYAFKSNDSTDEGVRWLKITDVGIQKIEDRNVCYLPAHFKENYSKFVLKKGDVVVALTRPVLGDRLKITIVDNNADGSLLNQRVGKLQTDENLIYIYYLMQCNRVITSIVSNIAGTDPPNLAPAEINHIPVYIGNQPEQQKIADFLTAIDHKINQLTKKQSLLQEYKKGVMQLLFNQKNHLKSENGKAFPKWKEYRLKDILLIQTDALDMKDDETYELITVKRRFGGIVSRGDYLGKDVLVKNQFMIHENEFVISKRQIVHGACGLVPSELVGAIVSNEYNVFRPVTKLLDIDYFNRFATTLFMRRAFFINSDGVHIEKLLFKTQSWLKTNVQIPCIEEQQKIVQFLQSVDEKIETVTEQIEKVKEFKKGLLQQMFL